MKQPSKKETAPEKSGAVPCGCCRYLCFFWNPLETWPTSLMRQYRENTVSSKGRLRKVLHGKEYLEPWYKREPQVFSVLAAGGGSRQKTERMTAGIRSGCQISMGRMFLIHYPFPGNRILKGVLFQRRKKLYITELEIEFRLEKWG